MKRFALILSNSLAITAIFVSSHVNSQTNPDDCAEINNDVTRLACYDTFFKTEPQNKQESLVASSLSASSTPKVVASPQPVLANVEQKANQSTKVAEAEKLDEFGAEDLADRAQQAEITKIESTVTKVSENSRGIRTFTLANGQVWREIQSSRLRIKVGTSVYIEKGALSSHFLGKIGANRRVKINRLK